jgi:hypothetical protein
MNQWDKPLIHGAPRGRVPRGGELKNSMDGIFQRLLKNCAPAAVTGCRTESAAWP